MLWYALATAFCVLLGRGSFALALISDLPTDVPNIDSTIVLQPNQPKLIPLAMQSKYAFHLDIGGETGKGFAVFQAHTQAKNLSISASPRFDAANSENGTGRGIVLRLSSQTTLTSPVAAYIWNYHDGSVNTLVSFHTYTNDVPMPGACNEEFTFENDANIHLTSAADGFLSPLQFQYGDVPVRQASADESFCDNTQSWKWLQYDVYVYYLPGHSLAEDDYLKNIQQFLTVADVTMRGKQVLTIQRGLNGAKPRLSFTSEAGQGFLASVIVRSVNNSLAAASYVPDVFYGCDPSSGTDCQSSALWLVMIYQGAIAVAGIVLCFFGHRLFSFEMLAVGFLTLLFPTYVAVARMTALPFWALLVTASACGILGGVSWLTIWWRFDRAILSMLLAGVVLGYTFGAIFYVTPFGALQFLHYDAGYWAIFCFWMFIAPWLFVVFKRQAPQLNIVTCAVVGSYCILSALSSYIGADLHRWALMPVLRATVSGFSSAEIIFPYQLKDALLSAAWALLAALGIVVQLYREKWRPGFPAPLRQAESHSWRVNPNAYVDEHCRLVGSDDREKAPPAYGAVA